jgi:hypothetical protein
VIANNNRSSAAVDRRAWKAARRGLLVQCSRCHCIGTGRVNARQKLTSVNLAAEHTRNGWLHAACGGQFIAYDIETADA